MGNHPLAIQMAGKLADVPLDPTETELGARASARGPDPRVPACGGYWSTCSSRRRIDGRIDRSLERANQALSHRRPTIVIDHELSSSRGEALRELRILIESANLATNSAAVSAWR